MVRGRFPSNLLVSDDVLNDGKVRGGILKAGTKRSDKRNILDGLGSNIVEKTMGRREISYSNFFNLDAWFNEMLEQLPERVQQMVKGDF